MRVKTWDATPSDLELVLQQMRTEAASRKTNLILFLADNDPSTNLSWCPDCVRAEPVIYKTLEEWPEEVGLIRAYAGDRSTWRNSAHPWRRDPRFNLTGVPTLIRLEGDRLVGRLEDHEAHLPHKIHALLASA